MPKIDQTTKASRKERVFLTLRRNPLGRSVMELSEITGIERRTLDNYLDELLREGKVYKEDKSPLWAALPWEQTQLRKFELSPEEAMTLYLAARLFTKQHDKRNEPAETALMKLATALVSDAKIGNEIHQAALELSHRPDDGSYNRVFRAIMQGYVYRRIVRLTYEPATGSSFTTEFAPYLLEPSAIGFTTYVIGHSSIVNKLRTFKLERIREATLTRQEYSIPPDFHGLDVLRSAWSIIYGEELVTVVLRFGPSVRKRVMETRWHPSETKEDDPEKPDHLRWSARVADTLDMLPWVKGWGADVEVLEPKALRGVLVRETQKMAELYQMMEMRKQLIAHIREKDKERQSLMEHLAAVSNLSGQFASKIGLKEAGEILGLLHDLGKASEQFQNYLLSGTGEKNPDADGYIDPEAMRGKIDHSTAGAQVIYENLWRKGHKGKAAAQVLALCIASHHSGLIDCLAPDGENNFKRRMEKADKDTHKSEAISNMREIQTALESSLSEEVIEQIVAKLQILKEEANESQNTLAFKAGLLVRFLLSCLIDADRLDTADFESPGNVRIRNYGQYHPWETLIERLDNRLKEFEKKNEVDELRAQVSQACFDFASKPKGIYQLTVPTGGGKTLASLRFALNHAVHHSKTDNKIDRIFYVIPYTSIIDQNAEEIRKILEDKDDNGKYLDRVVLEHHSNLTPEEETRRQNLLAQNWDAPVVLTTQVQFLEALFGAHTRSPRRMHQLAKSVIILDEVQTIPINMIHLLNLALRFLVHACGSTVVLCTATQPPLDKLDNPYRALIINPEQRIIQNEKELFEKLKRVEVFDKRKVGGWGDEEVAELAERQLQEKGSVLAVVNTKKSARALYHAIADGKIAGVHLYHLSTNMCPAHRLNVLNKIKEKLNNKEPVICVSTQLIEAGVDIDFGAVIRYLAGLDSIAQSAGRCNRHGVREGFGNVWIVNPKEEKIAKLKDIIIGIDKAQRVLDDFKSNQIGLEAMAAYYKYYYYERRGEMEYKVGVKSSAGQEDTLFNLLSTNTLSMQAHNRIHKAPPDIVFSQSFQTAAKAFQVIDSPTRGVVVQYSNEGKELVADLCGAPELEKQYKLLKRAQRYSVNLFQHEFDKLHEMGAIHEVQKGAGVFYLDEQYYSDDFGWSDEPVNDMKVQIL